jgi:hypothetical protein
VGGAVGDAVGDAVGGAVRDAVDDAVGGAVGDAVRGAVRDAVHDAVGVAVGGAVRGAVRDAVGDAVRDAVDGAVKKQILDKISQLWPYLLGGQFWVGGWWGSPAFVSYFREVCGLTLSEDMEARADAYSATCESACWWWPHREFVMVCERPTAIHRDDQGRLHNLTGPAIVWPDGWGIYSVSGIRVPADLIENPAGITVARIEAEQNAEIRRVMVDLYGLARYVRDAGFELVDDSTDSLGLPRRLHRRSGMLVVEMTNSTPDGDGSRRVYFGAVHPELRLLLPDGMLGEPQALSALAAVASTYGMRANEYVLAVET